MIEAAGAGLVPLPPCSRGLNPVARAFARPKALLRKARERSVPGLRAAIGTLLDRFSPAGCRNRLQAAGYPAR